MCLAYLSFRYQLAIGGVTEAQAAPSATMGGAKTALIGATQNAAQIAPGTGLPGAGGLSPVDDQIWQVDQLSSDEILYSGPEAVM